MKGAIFQELQAFISDNWGEELYAGAIELVLLSEADAFQSSGDYSEKLFLDIVEAAAEDIGNEPGDFLRVFGRYLCDGILSGQGIALEGVQDLCTLIEMVEGALLTDLDSAKAKPKVTFEEVEGRGLRIQIVTNTDMGPLFSGFVEAAATCLKAELDWQGTEMMSTGLQQDTVLLQMDSLGQTGPPVHEVGPAK